MARQGSNLKDLSHGGTESLRALIQAIAPETKIGGNDALDRLTDKLSELIGADAEEEFKQQRNERGELVNEEGLPIIDITEPMDAEPPRGTSASLPPPVSVEPLIKLTTLSEVAQARLKEQRSRILDLLEEEELRLEQQGKEREEQIRKEALIRKRQDVGRDQERVKEARELQKKMGRALLKNVALAREKEHEENELRRIKDEENERRKSPMSKKKTVVFADSVQGPSTIEGNDLKENWGDIVPATLRPSSQHTLLPKEKQTMKMTVVERVPGSTPAIPLAYLPHNRSEPDSDDESDPEPINSSDDDDDDDLELEADDVDYDYAQHQREIALEYFRKRDSIGQAAADALRSHGDHEEDHSTENPDILKDSPTPVVSQFRANRLVAAYQSSAHKSNTSEPSSSLGESVLSASGARTIQRSIRTGKVDADGKLVGGEADSASENEDERLQEVLNLIKKGEVLNAGPDNDYLATIPPKNDPWQHIATGAAFSELTATQRPSELSPPTVRSKTSKFKVSRAAAGRPNPSIIADLETLSEIQSTSNTPVSNAPRSSPKSTTPIDELNPVFPYTIHAPKPTISSALPPQISMIVESPDFPRPSWKGSSAQYTTDNTFMSSVVDSPSFPSASMSTTTRRPERPPAILSSKVVETQSRGAPVMQPRTETTATKRVSRFKQERM